MPEPLNLSDVERKPITRISIELDNRDWGKVARSIQEALNWHRNQLSEARGSYNSHDHVMRLEKEIATLARIKQAIWMGRKGRRASIVDVRRASAEMRADMYGENGNG